MMVTATRVAAACLREGNGDVCESYTGYGDLVNGRKDSGGGKGGGGSSDSDIWIMRGVMATGFASERR